MTEPTALAQLRHLYQNMVNGSVRDTASAKRIAEGLLALAIEVLERGTPPAVAGKPVAWMGTHDKTDLYYRKPPQADVVPLYATPQPTQAQAGAVPLTDEQIKELIEDGVFFGNCKEIVRAIEQVHGIKGGQHGTE